MTSAELNELFDSLADTSLRGSMQFSFILKNKESGLNVQQAFIRDSLDNSLAATFECAGGNTGADVDECEKTADNMAGEFGSIKPSGRAEIASYISLRPPSRCPWSTGRR